VIMSNQCSTLCCAVHAEPAVPIQGPSTCCYIVVQELACLKLYLVQVGAHRCAAGIVWVTANIAKSETDC
jgi:hypothetical protein